MRAGLTGGHLTAGRISAGIRLRDGTRPAVALRRWGFLTDGVPVGPDGSGEWRLLGPVALEKPTDSAIKKILTLLASVTRSGY